MAPTLSISDLLGCLPSKEHDSASQGRIREENCMCCYTEKENADQSCDARHSQQADTGSTSPSVNPVRAVAWQGSHQSTMYQFTGVAGRGKRGAIPGYPALEVHALPLGKRGGVFSTTITRSTSGDRPPPPPLPHTHPPNHGSLSPANPVIHNCRQAVSGDPGFRLQQIFSHNSVEQIDTDLFSTIMIENPQACTKIARPLVHDVLQKCP